MKVIIRDEDVTQVECFRIECPVCGEVMTMDEEPDMFGVFDCWNKECDTKFEAE